MDKRVKQEEDREVKEKGTHTHMSPPGLRRTSSTHTHKHNSHLSIHLCLVSKTHTHTVTDTHYDTHKHTLSLVPLEHQQTGPIRNDDQKADVQGECNALIDWPRCFGPPAPCCAINMR